jgi:hypothetical protein
VFFSTTLSLNFPETLNDMAERTFGGRPLTELKKLRKSSVDGGIFYLALLEAAPELFQLADDFETLLAFVQSHVEKIEDAAGTSAVNGPHQEALMALKESLNDPAILKIFAAR